MQASTDGSGDGGAHRAPRGSGRAAEGGSSSGQPHTGHTRLCHPHLPPASDSVFWRSWARVIRGRLPAIGRPNAEILHHGPPPAYVRGQAAVGGAEPWQQVHPGILRGVRAAAGL